MKVKWISDQTVLAIHRWQIAEHGGAEGLRDEGLLQSALARPRFLLEYNDHPPDIAALAASYAYGIIRNHPFIDGNKRVSLVVARTFLILNNKEMIARPEDKYLTWLRLAEGNLTEDELADWIRARLVGKKSK